MGGAGKGPMSKGPEAGLEGLHHQGCRARWKVFQQGSMLGSGCENRPGCRMLQSGRGCRAGRQLAVPPFPPVHHDL